MNTTNRLTTEDVVNGQLTEQQLDSLGFTSYTAARILGVSPSRFRRLVKDLPWMDPNATCTPGVRIGDLRCSSWWSIRQVRQLARQLGKTSA
jgi:hypothetical protein